MKQWVLPHDLPNGEGINARLFEWYRTGSDIFTHFKNVIHAGALPSFCITAEVNIYILRAHGIAGRLRSYRQPEVIVVVIICMANHNIYNIRS